MEDIFFEHIDFVYIYNCTLNPGADPLGSINGHGRTQHFQRQ